MEEMFGDPNMFSHSCMIICSYPSAYMSLWLKAEGYSVTQINQLPTVVSAITIVASWLGTTVAAIYPTWAIYTIASAFCLFSTLCMVIWNIPRPLKFVSYILAAFHTLMVCPGLLPGTCSDSPAA